MTVPADYSWGSCLRDLATWHGRGSAAALSRALVFAEQEVRLATPPVVRDRLGPEGVDEAVQEFLERLMRRPLPDGVRDPAAFVATSWRNHALTALRTKRRREARVRPADVAVVTATVEPQALGRLEAADDRRLLRSALGRLRPDDRLVLKLEHAPEWLDREELEALAERGRTSVPEVVSILKGSPGSFELSVLFDPPTPGEPPAMRRTRLERFRKRRNRALARLRELMVEGGDA